MPFKLVPQRDRKLYRLVKRGEVLTLPRGSTLYREGSPPGPVYLVRTGWLRLTLGPGDENGRTVGVVGPWELAGEEGLGSGTPRRTGTTAGTAAQVTVLDGGAVLKALGTSEKSLESYLRAKEEELSQARALAGARLSGGAPARLALVLLHLAHRLGKEEKGGIRIPLRVTHRLLGELSGAHRSTVTTILNDWIYRDLVDSEGGVLRVVDRGALARETGGWESPRSVDLDTLQS